MEQEKDNTTSRKGKHLNRNERFLIEGFLKAGIEVQRIAQALQRDRRTIEREIARGMVEHLNYDLTKAMVYNADRAQDVHDQNATAKGAPVKLQSNSLALRFIALYISKKKWSPEAVAARMKLKGISGSVCAKSIYNYIDLGEIPGVSNETLWEKRTRGKKHKALYRHAKRAVSLDRSIADRPEHINDRTEAGHWEIDLVVGGRGKGSSALMTLVERKTRKLIVRKIKDKSQASVIRAIDSIERSMGPEVFRVMFKSITADNGSEFLDYLAMERSVYSSTSRTHIYYARPYSSWERGTNENANRIIRRFIAKGCNIGRFTHASIRAIEEWINTYPRKILNYKTAEEVGRL